MRGAACGRADLVRAFAAGGSTLLDGTAQLLGYERPPEASKEPEPPRLAPDVAPQPLPRAPEIAQTQADEPDDALAAVPFWRASRLSVRDEGSRERAPERKVVTWASRPSADPPRVPLSPVGALLPRLRRAVAVVRLSRRVDVARVVRLLGRGRDLTRIPRLRRLRWGRSLHVLCDRSLRLVPYWADQDHVWLALSRLYPRGGLTTVLCDETSLFSMLHPRAAHQALPAPGTRVLVLGDLGCLDLAPERRVVSAWATLGRRLASRGLMPVALLPCGPGRLAAAPPRGFRLVSHEPQPAGMASRAPQAAAVLAAAAEQLLGWLAPAVRIQPELLRRARLELGQGSMHAGIESVVWQHPAAATRHPAGLSLEPREAQKQREIFAAESERVRRAALGVMRAFRGGALPQSIWFEELLGLDPDSQRLAPADDVATALAYVRDETLPTLLAQWAEPARPGAARWLGALADRLPREAWTRDEARALRQSWIAAYPDDPSRAPFVTNPAEALSRRGWPERRVRIVQAAGDLVFASDELPTSRASPLGTIRAGFPRLRIERRSGFWRAGAPPQWASDWGTDPIGPWVEFELAGVRQRLRWIPPGRFRMGSPKDEPGRWEDEGPQHDVAIGVGFWLFDTPCTQALWEAVMGQNPSRFPGAERPVEKVSWDQCRDFLAQLNRRAPGLQLTLPSEAQWEYAGRAGTQTATYAGGNDAATLEEIAWYTGNAGSETHAVKGKRPNQWGLFDTLGNVFEWVADTWHDSFAGAPVDGTAWVDSKQGSARVIRGGSWDDGARSVRAAYRSRYAPGDRDGILGFRCARVQDQAEPAGGEEDRSAERRSSGSSGASVALWVGPGGDRPQPLDAASSLIIESDLETLELERLTQPAWARSIGRDRFGLWSEFELPTHTGAVAQRMRWIPPGRFRMGSPPDEAGRWESEGPQHDVTIGRGFWLFDTPCTQALWDAVMDHNPSRFQHRGRPVEQVSWDACREFLERVNARVPGLQLVLPSEAQWEYACRAGTETATYAGPMEIVGENNAPVLDEIAWYGGNSGVEFELENGVDSSGWPQKQHKHSRAGSHPVGGKRANEWGLFDMLGNVWEWVEDTWHDDYVGAPGDGTAWVDSEQGSARVIRGGSWYARARHVRAASRGRHAPGVRRGRLGFRCARVQGRPEPVRPREDRSAERRSDAAQPEGASRRRQQAKRK